MIKSEQTKVAILNINANAVTVTKRMQSFLYWIFSPLRFLIRRCWAFSRFEIKPNSNSYRERAWHIIGSPHSSASWLQLTALPSPGRPINWFAPSKNISVTYKLKTPCKWWKDNWITNLQYIYWADGLFLFLRIDDLPAFVIMLHDRNPIVIAYISKSILISIISIRLIIETALDWCIVHSSGVLKCKHWQ